MLIIDPVLLKFVIFRSSYDDDDNDVEWDGIEIRLLNLLSKMFNFTTDYREARNWELQGFAHSTIVGTT